MSLYILGVLLIMAHFPGPLVALGSYGGTVSLENKRGYKNQPKFWLYNLQILQN
jgi:hypothetical protein